MLPSTPRFFLPVALLLVAACGSYDFTVNDTLVYTPKPLFSDFDIADRALYECLKQSIVDLKITRAIELTSLSCSHAGIESLQGLTTFTGLTHLKLTANKIRNLSAISTLPSLETLYLDDNVVVDPVPLYRLPALRVLDLSGNNALQCPSRSAFGTLESVTLPSHCS